jgi:hypothetical protein
MVFDRPAQSCETASSSLGNPQIPDDDKPTYQAQSTNCGTVGLMNLRRPWILDSRVWLGLGVLAFCLGISVYVCHRDRAIAAREGTAVGITTDRQSIRFGTRIIYIFSVNDQWFTGSESSSMGDDRWPGRRVSVYYDSQNPNENALTDFAELSHSPYSAVSIWWDAKKSRGWLIGGGFFLFLAIVGALTGDALSRGGMIYRDEEPKEFWWVIAIECIGGFFMIWLSLTS